MGVAYAANSRHGTLLYAPFPQVPDLVYDRMFNSDSYAGVAEKVNTNPVDPKNLESIQHLLADEPSPEWALRPSWDLEGRPQALHDLTQAIDWAEGNTDAHGGVEVGHAIACVTPLWRTAPQISSRPRGGCPSTARSGWPSSPERPGT